MRGSKIRLALLFTVALSLFWLAAAQAGAVRVADAIWAHGELYDTVITPTTFVSPPEQSIDTIYNFMMSGLTGQRSIADAAPGDPGFNGGRWNVMVAVFTDLGVQEYDSDGDGVVDSELMTAEEVAANVEAGYVEVFPANFYFECPMLPRRGR